MRLTVSAACRDTTRARAIHSCGGTSLRRSTRDVCGYTDSSSRVCDQVGNANHLATSCSIAFEEVGRRVAHLGDRPARVTPVNDIARSIKSAGRRA